MVSTTTCRSEQVLDYLSVLSRVCATPFVIFQSAVWCFDFCINSTDSFVHRIIEPLRLEKKTKLI